MLSLILTAGFTIITSVYLWRRWRRMQCLQNLGIEGPQPNVIFGNLWEIRNIGLHKFISKYTKVYGKKWGYYEGDRPLVVVSDPETIKNILVKEFQKFHSRKPGVFDSNNKFSSVFSASELTEWKRLRTIINPSFSAIRMREMSSLINSCIDRLLQLLDERCKQGKAFDVFSDLQKLTLDTIACCAFGVETNCIHDLDSPFLFRARTLFQCVNATDSWIGRYLIPIFVAFPKIMLAIRPISKVLLKTALNHYHWFIDRAGEIIEERKTTINTSKRVDFINLMLKANQVDVCENLKSLEMSDRDYCVERTSNSSVKNYLTMTKEEMESNCSTLLLAGFETTSTALALCAYHLALSPNIQTKLQQEIDDILDKEVVCPNNIQVQQLPYLDRIFKEVLRLYPVGAFAVTRHCSESCQIDEHTTLSTGFNVQIDMAGLHNDLEQWGPEPTDQFVPERFLPERVRARNSGSYLPFSIGPRNCIGMRFALMEAKIALVRILKKFTIQQCSETVVPLRLTENGVRGPAEDVTITLARR